MRSPFSTTCAIEVILPVIQNDAYRLEYSTLSFSLYLPRRWKMYTYNTVQEDKIDHYEFMMSFLVHQNIWNLLKIENFYSVISCCKLCFIETFSGKFCQGK